MSDAPDCSFARLGSEKIENRRAIRRACNISAWIRGEGSFATQKCQVIELSQIGVRLAVANAHRIPNGFILFFSKNSPGRHASIKWRRGDRIGAEFLSADDLQSIHLARRVASNAAKLRELLRR